MKMFHRRNITGIAAAYFLVFNIAYGDDQIAALDTLAGIPSLSGFQIDYDFTNITEPANQNAQSIEQAVNSFRKELETNNVADVEGMCATYKAQLEKKTQEKYKGFFTLGSSFYANHVSEGSKGGNIWDIRSGSSLYTLMGKNSLYIINDPEARKEDWALLARNSIGSLGRLTPEILKELKSQATEISKENGKLVYKKGNLTVTINVNGNQFELSSIEKVEPSVGQKDELLFQDYRMFNGISVPAKVTSTFTTKTNRISRVYAINNVRWKQDSPVPLINTSLGVTDVCDARFTPPIRYLAFKELPSDSQIAEWVSDPATLKKYNAAMQKIRRDMNQQLHLPSKAQ